MIGSALSAGGTATLAAQHNVALLTSVDTQSSSSQSSNHSKSFTAAPVGWGDAARSLQGGANSSGVSMSPYNSQSGTTQGAQQVVNETGTTIDAGQINVISQQGDIVAEGAQLTAQHDINVLAAQGKIDLGTGEASQQQQSHQSGHQVGDLGGNGYSGTVGERQELHDQNGSQTWQSTLRTGLTSTQGDVNVVAHGDLTGQGVDIAGRDVTLVGRNVTLTPSADTAEQQQRDKMSQVGVTVALSGVAVQAAQAVDAAVDAHDRGNDRLAVLYAAEAVYGAKDSVAAAQGQSSTGLVKVTVSIGSSHQSSNTSYQEQTQRGSTVAASRDVTIVATGDGTKGADGYAANGDIVLQGAQIQAGRDASLVAARDITLTAGQDTTDRDSANHSGSASIGVGFALGGEQNGFTIELAAAAAKGKGNGDSITNHVTTINAGDTLSLSSGRDTTLEGAQAQGETILADIGRNLTLTSLQDTDHYKETYQSASAGLSLCIPPICYGSSSGGASYSQSNISNQYQSVTEQTGLAAGSGGFDIYVGGTTALTGAVIASSADPSRNLLDTGTLTVTDLHNEVNAKVSSTNLSVDSSMASGSKYAIAKGVVLNALGSGNEAEHKSSMTLSDIAAGTVVVRDGQAGALANLDRTATDLMGGNSLKAVKVQNLQEDLEFSLGLKALAYREGVKYTDEAYQKMFLEKADMYEVVKDENGKLVPGRKLTEEEKMNLQPGADGKVHIANNGIFNSEPGAEKYADQHSGADGPQYYILFQHADNGLSELLIAGYQKTMENDFWGLTNATEEVKLAMWQYGQSGLQLDGHSRGSLTIGNALESLERANGEGMLSGTTISFFGPAYNTAKADGILSYLQDREAKSDPQAWELTLQNHIADPVGRYIGGNPATGGTIPDGSSIFEEIWRAATGQKDTSHNCYGYSSSADCGNLWKDAGK